MSASEAITLHTRCLLAKLGTGRPVAFHVQAILRNLRHRVQAAPHLPKIGTHSLN